MNVSEAQIVASLCRESFVEFVQEMWHTVVPEKLMWNWHIEEMCRQLQEIAEPVFRGEEKDHDLIINISPGTTKSTVASVMFPAWVWTRMPHACTIGASYAHPLALDLSRRCRDVVKSDLYQACFPGISLRPDQDTKGYFANTRGGYRYAVGSNGSVQGMHGHFIIIDDPVDPNRAVSDVELATINDWIKNTLSGRKKDKRVTVTILIMQRLAQDDPTSEMSERPGVRWIRIPATTEYEVRPPELKEHYTDGVMDPVRLSRKVLDEEMKVMGKYGFAGQHGQDPVPAGGGMFKTDMFRYAPLPDRWQRVVRFWDKAATIRSRKSKKPAWTVGVKMGIDEVDRLFVADVKRVRLDSFSRERLIKRTAVKDGRGCEVAVEQEPGSAGKDSALATLRRLRGWRVRIVPAAGAKEVRADEFSVQVNSGLVYLPAHLRQGGRWIGWAYEFVDELKHWPFSTYLDQGDAAGGCFNVLSQPVIRVGPLPRHSVGS